MAQTSPKQPGGDLEAPHNAPEPAKASAQMSLRCKILLGAFFGLFLVGVVYVTFRHGHGAPATADPSTGTKDMQGPVKSISTKPSDQCKKGLRYALQEKWTLSYFNRSGKGEITSDVMDVDAIYSKFVDSDTFNIVIEKEKDKSCSKASKTVLWLYPTTAADDTGAFGLGNGECSRLEYFVDNLEVECIQVYHVNSAPEATSVLDKYHGDGTVIHAVLGGHGSDQIDQGLLQWSGSELMAGSDDFLNLLKTLKNKMAGKSSTIFADSCFAGINGVAKQISEAIPEAWVFGGVVSLTSEIKVHDNKVKSEEGPPRLVSEFSFDKVVNASDKDSSLGSYQGERMLAFHSGENKGSVNQWRFPSKNKKIVRVGASVRSLAPVGGFRVTGATFQEVSEGEYQPQDGQFGFLQQLPADLNGKVMDVDSAGEVPATGMALILWSIPKSWGEETGGAGKTLGQYFVTPDDFEKLMVEEEEL